MTPSREDSAEDDLARLAGDASLGEATLGQAMAALRALQGALEDTRPEPGGDDQPPRLPDRYREVETIGRGGMGMVLRAFDTEIERPVAIKVLRARSVSDAQREKFLLEAKIHANLEHPGIVPIHEIGRSEDGRDWFSMKLVRGRTLAQVLAGGGPGSLAALLGIHLKICETVAFAHSRGVIHRDLKPGNVMIGEFGEVMLMDWGLAKVLDRSDPATEATDRRSRIESFRVGADATLAGQVLGTPAYMSPEQATGDLDRLDEKSDVYGLGAILYEMLAGVPPHAGVGVFDVVERVAAGEFPPPSAHGRPVPRELEEVVLRAMALDPARRYPRVTDLSADLGAFLEGRTLSAVRYGSLERAAKWVRRHRALAAGAAAVLAVLAGAIETVAIRDRREEARRFEAALARDRERVHLDAGRRLLEQMRHSRRDVEQTERDLDRLAALAEAEFRRALDEVPDDAEAMLAIGETRWLARRPEAALEWIERAIEVSPTFAPAYALRARCRLPGYVQQRSNFLGGFDPAADPEADAERLRIEEDLRAFERHARRADEVGLARGLLALIDGDHARAIEEIAAYVDLYPGDGDAHFWLGVARFRLGRLEDALAAFLRAQRCDVRTVQHSINVIMTLQRLGRADEALRVAETWTTTFPEVLDLQFARGSALQRLGRPAEAIAAYDRVLAGRPDDVLALTARGVARRDAGDPTAALADFDRAVTLLPGGALPRLDRGAVRAMLGDRDGAREDFDEAIRLAPDLAAAYLNRGALRFRSGDPSGGLTDLDRAVELDPRNVRILYERARCREAIRDYEGSLADYEAVLAIEPGLLEARIRRGRVRARRGDVAGAIEDLEAALAAAPADWTDRAEVEAALVDLRSRR